MAGRGGRGKIETLRRPLAEKRLHRRHFSKHDPEVQGCSVEKKAETDDVDRIKIRRHLNAGFRFELGDPNTTLELVFRA